MRRTGFAVMAVMSVIVAAPAAGAGALAPAGVTYTVTSTGTGGDTNVHDGVCHAATNTCTLRAAIEQANSHAGKDTIRFKIGHGLKTITPSPALPAIKDAAVVDATSQPGWAGFPMIVLNGASSGSGGALKVAAANTTVKGFDIVNGDVGIAVTGGHDTLQWNFLGVDATGRLGRPLKVGITLASDGNQVGSVGPRNVINHGMKVSGKNNKIQGNYIGVDAGGRVSLGDHETAIYVTGSGNVIGGVSKGNIISGNGGYGVYVIGPDPTICPAPPPITATAIQGNYIGVDDSGARVLANQGGGIYIQNASQSTIGGAASGAGNVINGGIDIASVLDVCGGGSSGTHIYGNDIGVGVDGSSLGNTSYGVAVFGVGANDTAIGGVLSGQANTIAYNKSGGVLVGATFQGDADRASIRGNSMYGNGDPAIDLGGDGVSSNDPLDTDGGANATQNYPVVTAASTDPSETTINGELDSAARQTYTVDLYASDTCDPSGNGEGSLYLDSVALTTNNRGHAAFGVVVQPPVALGQYITATATDAVGRTSEFSSCTQVLSA